MNNRPEHSEDPAVTVHEQRRIRAVIVAWSDGDSGRVAPAMRIAAGPARVEFHSPGEPVGLLAVAEPLALRRAATSLLDAMAATLNFPVWVGVGGVIGPFRSGAMSRIEAERAIQLAQIVRRRPGVVLHEDMMMVEAISADGALRGRLAGLLDVIADYDRRKKESLLDNLQTYFDFDLSRRLAADALGIHPHTLHYRVQKIERLLGRSLRSTDDVALVKAAVIARRLQEENR